MTKDEIKQKIAILKAHKDSLVGYHPGDDSPYAYTYGGYTVRETRSSINNKLKQLKSLLK